MTDEYIKKSKALDELNYIVQYYGGKSRGAIEAHETIYMMEPEDVRPVVRGRWVDGKCDNCGEHAPYWCLATTFHESNYCPNCGAQMDADMRENG